MITATDTHLKRTVSAACMEDRRITKSKRALRKALIDVLEEDGYECATVNDLCARADLNRGTFYNHFKDKEDLLNTLEEEIFNDLAFFQSALKDITFEQILVSSACRTPMPVLVSLFEYLKKQGDFLHAVMGKGGDVKFGPRLREVVCNEFIWSFLHDKYRENPTPFVEYYVSFFASAYLGVIARWVETGMKESPQDMALIAMRLFFIKPGESIEL